MHEQFFYVKSQNFSGLSAFSAKMTDFSYDKHAHEEYSIGVTCSGRQDFYSQGAHPKSNAGNIIFFNPEQVHDGHAGAGSPMEYQMLYIPEHLFLNLSKSFSVVVKDKLHIKQSLFQDNILRDQVLSFFQLMSNCGQYSCVEEEYALLRIVQSIVRIGGSGTSALSPQSRKDALLIRAKDFILENLQNKITVDEIANAANISKYHFIRMFSEQFGMTPHQYVLASRINRCKAALEYGEKAIDVANKFGFSDVSHLNRKFKNTFGITPTQYQKQLST